MMRPTAQVMAMILLSQAGELAGQAPDTSAAPAYRRRLIVLPFLGYAPETKLQFGAGGGLQFKWPSAVRDSGTRASYVFAAASVTTKGQWLAGTELSLSTPGNRWRLFGRIGGAYYPLFYFGIGPETERADSNRMDNRVIKVEAKALRRIVGDLSVGPYYRLNSYFDIDWQHAAQVAPGTPGASGGVSSGIGVSVQLDSRRSTTTPRNGHLVQVDYLRNASFLGGDFDYDYLVVDARLYLPVWRGRDVVALNLYGEFNGEEVPIQTMSMISNGTTQELMRGVYLGRYRDQHQWAAQADYRGHLKGRFGYVVFGSAGTVFGSPGSSALESMKYTYGAGLRFNLNPADPINLRADFTFTSFGESGFTFGASEAF